MKRIECYLRQEDCETAVKALSKEGATGVAMTAMAGLGVERVPYPSLQQWMSVSVVVSDDRASAIAESVADAVARHGGGGRIAVQDVESLIAIGVRQPAGRDN